jgi:hypothetical protein
MTTWRFERIKNGIKVSRSNDGGKSYSLGTTSKNVRAAINSIIMWAQPYDIIDLGGIEEPITGIDPYFESVYTWHHIPVFMGGTQGMGRN